MEYPLYFKDIYTGIKHICLCTQITGKLNKQSQSLQQNVLVSDLNIHLDRNISLGSNHKSCENDHRLIPQHESKALRLYSRAKYPQSGVRQA